MNRETTTAERIGSRPPATARPTLQRAAQRLALAVLLAMAMPSPLPAQDAPYDASLNRFAEILGALHYLRGLCGADEGPLWRNEMQALLEAEASNGPRRNALVASFNRGYRGFERTHRTCTPTAETAIRRYLEEGARIARELSTRFGN